MYSAVDGDFAENSGQTSTSFEDFLSAMGSEVPDSNEGMVRDDYNNLEEDVEEVSEREKLDSFEELLEDQEEEEKEAWEVEGEEGEEGEDSEDDEKSEEGDSEDSEEGYDYLMEDWDSSVVLPNGMEVGADKLMEFLDFENKLKEFETKATEVSRKEMLLAQNSEIGIAALNHIEHNLQSIASQRPLNVLEQAQFQTLQQMKAYYSSTTETFANMHKDTVINMKRAEEAQFQHNMDVCFTKYPNLHEDIVVIKDYLAERGVADPNAYLMSVKMDPVVVNILQDAITFKKVQNKVQRPAKRISKSIRGKTDSNLEAPAKEAFIPPGISSYDANSYKQFSSIEGIL